MYQLSALLCTRINNNILNNITTMRKKVLTACAAVCTVCVLGAICLGQVNKGRSVSKLVLENIEALTPYCGGES